MPLIMLLWCARWEILMSSRWAKSSSPKSRIKEHSQVSEERVTRCTHTPMHQVNPPSPTPTDQISFSDNTKITQIAHPQIFNVQVWPESSAPSVPTLRTWVERECVLIFLIWTSFQALEDN